MSPKNSLDFTEAIKNGQIITDGKFWDDGVMEIAFTEAAPNSFVSKHGVLPTDVLSLIHVCKDTGNDLYLSFSLDFEDNKANAQYQIKRCHPQIIRRTKMSEELFLADIDLKQMAMGVVVRDYLAPPDSTQAAQAYTFPAQLAAAGVKSITDFRLSSDMPAGIARIWIYIRPLDQISRESDGSIMLSNIKCGVNFCSLSVNSEGKLVDSPVQDPNSPEGRFARAMTDNFSLVADYCASFARVQQLARAFAIASWVVTRKVPHDEALCNSLFQANLIPGHGTIDTPQLAATSQSRHTNYLMLEGTYCTSVEFNASRAMTLLTERIYNLNLSCSSYGKVVGQQMWLDGSQRAVVAMKSVSLTGGIKLSAFTPPKVCPVPVPYTPPVIKQCVVQFDAANFSCFRKSYNDSLPTVLADALKFSKICEASSSNSANKVENASLNYNKPAVTFTNHTYKDFATYLKQMEDSSHKAGEKGNRFHVYVAVEKRKKGDDAITIVTPLPEASGIYYPTGGKCDIGYGHKLTAKEVQTGMVHGIDVRNGITAAERDHILAKDIELKRNDLAKRIPQWHQLDQKQQEIFIDFHFTGVVFKKDGSGDYEFPKLFKAVIDKDWKKVEEECNRKSGGAPLTGRNQGFKDYFLKKEMSK